MKNCIVSIPVIKDFLQKEGFDMLCLSFRKLINISWCHFSFQLTRIFEDFLVGALFALPVDGGDRSPHLSAMAWR